MILMPQNLKNFFKIFCLLKSIWKNETERSAYLTIVKFELETSEILQFRQCFPKETLETNRLT